MTNRNNYTLDTTAFGPAVIIAGTYLISEIIVSLLALAVLASVCGNQVSPRVVTATVCTIVCIGEIFHRAERINLGLIGVAVRIAHRFRRVASKVAQASTPYDYNAVRVLYLVLTAVFLYVGIPLLAKGLSHEVAAGGTSQLSSTGVAIISGAMALFFTVAGVTVQSITQRYPAQFLRAVIWHPLFRISFLSMLVLLLGGLLILHAGSNIHLNRLTLYACVYVVLTLGLMVILVVHFLDVTRIAAVLGRRVRALTRRIPRGTSRRGDAAPALRPAKSYWAKLQEAVAMRVVGVFDPQAIWTRSRQFSVPTHLILPLREGLRPLISACRTSILADDREVALACLDEIVAVSAAYLRRRRNYTSTQDDFLGFVAAQIEGLFKTSLRSLNQQYTADIVQRAESVAVECIPLTPSLLGDNENPLVTPCILFLKNAVLQSVPLELTTAPPDGIDAIGRVGVGLINSRALVTAVFMNSATLREIGVLVIDLGGGAWTCQLCQRCVARVLEMLLALLRVIGQKGWGSDLEVSTTCDHLETVLTKAYEADLSHPHHNAIAASFTGAVANTTTVPGLVMAILSLRFDNPRWHRRTLDELGHVVEMFTRVASRATTSRRGTPDQFSRGLSEMAFAILAHLRAVQLSDIGPEGQTVLESAEQLLAQIVAASVRILSAYGAATGPAPSFLYNLSPLPALLAYYSREQSTGPIAEGFSNFIHGALEVYERLSPDTAEAQTRKARIHSYLKLVGAWLRKYRPRSDTSKSLTLALARDYAVYRSVRSPVLLGPMERLGYPTGMMSDQWYMHPSEFWHSLGRTVTEELNDVTNYRQYDALLRRVYGCIQRRRSSG